MIHGCPVLYYESLLTWPCVNDAEYPQYIDYFFYTGIKMIPPTFEKFIIESHFMTLQSLFSWIV